MPKNKVNKEFSPSVRTTNGIFIYFKNKETIYVHDIKKGRWVTYQRWFETRPGFYMNSWRRFCWQLKYNNKLSMEEIHSLAIRFGIQEEYTIKPPLKVFPERRDRDSEQKNRYL